MSSTPLSLQSVHLCHKRFQPRFSHGPSIGGPFMAQRSVPSSIGIPVSVNSTGAYEDTSQFAKVGLPPLATTNTDPPSDEKVHPENIGEPVDTATWLSENTQSSSRLFDPTE